MTNERTCRDCGWARAMKSRAASITNEVKEWHQCDPPPITFWMPPLTRAALSPRDEVVGGPPASGSLRQWCECPVPKALWNTSNEPPDSQINLDNPFVDCPCWVIRGVPEEAKPKETNDA